MTAEERKRLNEVCDKISSLKPIVDKYAESVDEHTKELKMISEKLNNGIIQQVDLIWKEIQSFHREKLELMKRHQDYLEGGDRREEKPVEVKVSGWQKLHWIQKTGVITAIIVFLFRPEIQEIAKTVLEQMFGINLQ